MRSPGPTAALPRSHAPLEASGAARTAEILATKLDSQPDVELVGAKQIARMLGVNESWVYAHASELGAIRLGTGPKSRVRFDPARARCSSERDRRTIPSFRLPPQRQSVTGREHRIASGTTDSTEVAMARPNRGHVKRTQTKLETSYALRIMFQGEHEYVTLGGSWEGWNEERVQIEREHIARQIARGEWVPPSRHAPPPRESKMGAPTFHELAIAIYNRKKAEGLADNSLGAGSAAAAGHVPARAHEPEFHDARLPAGARHVRERPRGP